MENTLKPGKDAMPVHAVVFVFSQLRSGRFSMYFHLLSSTPNSFYTGGHIYPVEMNIYKGLKIPLPVKSQKHVFLPTFSSSF